MPICPSVKEHGKPQYLYVSQPIIDDTIATPNEKTITERQRANLCSPR